MNLDLMHRKEDNMKYVDAEKIISEIERQQRRLIVLSNTEQINMKRDCALQNGVYESILVLINSLQQSELGRCPLKYRKKEEPVSEDLGDYINELSKQFPEVSFAKLSRIAVRVAKWQKEHLWKPADGEDLPEIDREVIVLLDNGSVAFGHRPPEYWDGKDIVTGKVTRNYPKTYDKGGWNIPNIKYWLDIELPKEIEL